MTPAFPTGQSNMWLPLRYSYSRNLSVSNISAGHLDNVRLMAGDSQRGTSFPWRTARQSLANGNASVPSYALFDFSAACWYFAEELTFLHRRAGREPPPLGLVSTAIGGSMIEEWTENATTLQCRNVSVAAHNEMLYDQKVQPYLSMTVKGFLWYQVRLRST